MKNELQTEVKLKPEFTVIFTMQDIVDWIQWLCLNERTKNTVLSYKLAIKQYLEIFEYMLSKSRIIKYKKILMDRGVKPQTINLRIAGINSLIMFFAERDENPKLLFLKIKTTKDHKRTSVENVITSEEFNKLLDFCKISNEIKDNEKYYMIIKTLGYTGVRVSELIKLEVKDIKEGSFFTVHSKGDKYRKILVPDKFKKELIDYINKHNIEGYLFKPVMNKEKGYTSRGIAQFLYSLSDKTGVPKSHCHPHAFRHMFAINLLEATKDLQFVSDMLGHAKIETTSIYLRMSLDKQKEIINNKVNW